MLRALADGETDPAALAALGDRRLHASQEQLCDALGAATDLKSTYRRLVGMALDEIAATRTPHEQTGSRDGGPAEFAPRCCSAACGGTWSRSRVGSSDHCRDRRRSENISFGEASGFVDWSVPR
jgi:hypothetical protein